MSNIKVAIQATYFSIAGNAGLALVKGLAGYFGNSYALVADAIESTADVFSSILVLWGIKYSTRPPDHNHPYGHGRAEPLITLLIVGFLLISALIIAYKSIENIHVPHKLPEKWTILVLLIIIFWKELSYRIVLQKSKAVNSTALKADAWHHRSDALTSLAALVGITVALVGGEQFAAADDWAALFAAAFILYNSYLIFRPALGEIMDEHLYDDLIANIRQIADRVEGIVNTEKCLVRKVGMKYHVDLHARVDAQLTVKEGHELAHRLKDALESEIPQLGYVLIHIEPSE